ncbi:MAG: hypothetical protein RIA69_05330 [Cyclobacteriaceae bacterium]
MKNLLFVFGLLCTLPSFSQDFEAIERQLEEINHQSLRLRSKVMPIIKEYGFDSPQMDSLNSKISEFDALSLDFVISIIDQYGWLGKKKIGNTGNQTLFLVIQHAPDNATRKKYFPLLEQSAEEGSSQRSDMATMKDRILVQDGQLQIYGTQSRMVDGKLEPFPIQDPDGINKRRKKVGLSKMK